MRRLETTVPPPIWAALLAAFVFGATRLGSPWTIGGWGRPVGLGLGVLGVAIAAAGVASFARARTTVDPHDPSKTSALVDTGVYRVTRNPMYLGLALVLGGWGLVLRDPVAGLVGVGVFVVVLTHLQIMPEERILRERFGPAYDAFCERTRRWI